MGMWVGCMVCGVIGVCGVFCRGLLVVVAMNLFDSGGGSLRCWSYFFIVAVKTKFIWFNFCGV